ncbi:MAG: PUR family DNA/RNA-binding protein [Bacteroidales bacterium]|nr:PUR family DNA/RNA-binding protein [Bacteroidota bacterium]MCK5078429.1 PUR family DNA/RNA-binding protein [Bacteroidales bacterium]
MEEQENKDVIREEIYSRVIRAGKRTYFFDVKATRAGEQYLTITESKRRFNNDSGKFYYEKHKLFLYKEDFEKFSRGLSEAIEFIETGKKAPEPEPEPDTQVSKPESIASVKFEDLGDPEETKEETKDE